MKKFFVTLLILLILAGTAVFFGWAQRGVPPDAYGIIRSKTHGVDTRLVIPGEFRWVWYKLIPTNVSTEIFRINLVNHNFSAYNLLPSAMVYSAFAGIEESFSWRIQGSFSFSLKPEALAALIADTNIGNQDELDRYETDLADQIYAFILHRINVDGEFAKETEELLKNGESPEFNREIEEKFPQITGFAINIISSEFPDFALYQQIKGLYEYYIAFQREHISGDLQEKAKNRIELYQRFEELEQYGRLLTQYPILIDYLKMEKGK